jgi:hypothetical protein
MARSTVVSAWNRDEQMHVIRHDDEIVQLELPRGDVRTQNVNQEHCIAFRLEQAPPHARLGGREKGSGRA